MPALATPPTPAATHLGLTSRRFADSPHAIAIRTKMPPKLTRLYMLIRVLLPAGATRHIVPRGARFFNNGGRAQP